MARLIQLLVILGTDPQNMTCQANFMVVKTSSSIYNVIIRLPLLNDIKVVSLSYLLMKFPSPYELGQVCGN